MLDIEDALAKNGLAARMLLQLHDELLFEVPHQELVATAKIVCQVMERVVALKAPLIVDLRAGVNWGEMHPMEKSTNFE